MKKCKEFSWVKCIFSQTEQECKTNLKVDKCSIKVMKIPREDPMDTYLHCSKETKMSLGWVMYDIRIICKGRNQRSIVVEEH